MPIEYKKKENRPPVTVILTVIFIIVIILFSLWFFTNKNKSEVEIVENVDTVTEEDSNSVDLLIEEVNKIILLPEEKPAVATIKDIVVLKEQQEFFNNAENGDRLLIYKDRALIYREAEKKIINIGSVNFNSQGEDNEPTLEQ